MKKLTLAVLLGGCLLSAVYAQSPTLDHSSKKTKRWQVANVGVHLSPYAYNFPDITLAGLTSLSQRPGALGNQLLGFEQAERIGADVIGSYLGAYVALNPRSRRKAGINTQQELRIGFAYAPQREAMVDYRHASAHQHVTYCLVESELVVSATYLFKTTWGSEERIQLYGGPGGQVSSTFDNLLFIVSSNVEGLERNELEAKASQYAKGYLQGGFSYQFVPHVAFTLEGQQGIGVQLVHGAENNLIGNFRSVNAGLQYQF